MTSIEEELVNIVLDNIPIIKRELTAMNNLRKRDSKIGTEQKKQMLIKKLAQKVQKRYIVQKR